jgi:uncharacterized protein YciI
VTKGQHRSPLVEAGERRRRIVREDGGAPVTVAGPSIRSSGMEAVVKYVVIGTSAGRSMEEIMEVFPRHKAVVDELIERGEVIGIGPFTDGGNMAVFRSEEAANDFVARDPFILEGLVASFEIRPWADDLLD